MLCVLIYELPLSIVTGIQPFLCCFWHCRQVDTVKILHNEKDNPGKNHNRHILYIAYLDQNKVNMHNALCPDLISILCSSIFKSIYDFSDISLPKIDLNLQD